MTSLQEERASLKAQTEKRKYTPRLDKAEGLRQQLGQCCERLEHAQAKRDQLVGLLNRYGLRTEECRPARNADHI